MVSEVIAAGLRHIVEQFAALNVPWALMGGVAMSAWRHPRFTRDLDVLIDVDQARLDDVLAEFAAAGIAKQAGRGVVRLDGMSVISLSYEPPEMFLDVQIDLFLAESEFLQAALGRAEIHRLPNLDVEVRVVACEDLILLKLMGGRILDQADAAALARANAADLDTAHLAERGRELGLLDELDRIWREAAPGAESPFGDAGSPPPRE